MLTFLSFFLLFAQPTILRNGNDFRLAGAELSLGHFQVFTGETPLLGTYRREAGAIVFTPRFPLAASLTVKARYAPPGAKPLEVVFPGRANTVEPTTRVVEVHPTAEIVPANLLKFYVDFSAPMQRGEVWRHIHLLDEAGKAVELPFLEIEQELWDPAQQRLTLLFDPGRIKRGVMPREQGGGALEPGQTYTLVIDAAWRDAANLPLVESFRKRFLVGPEDRQALVPSQWKILAPKAGTRDEVTLDLGEAADHALLGRMIQVVGVAGEVRLSERDSRWQFRPAKPWPAGKHRLRIDVTLEDLAGNKVNRAFDVDVFEKVTQQIDANWVELEFVAAAQ